LDLWIAFFQIQKHFIPWGGGNSVREKFCPGEILPGKILSQSLFCPGKILSHPAGMGEIKRPARSVGNFFEGHFAYNWSLCVG
jgi:hypothetical protein